MNVWKKFLLGLPFHLILATNNLDMIFLLIVAICRQEMGNITLKHKDSFGKSENLSKIFFAEILVFDHHYEGKSSSSNGLL